MKTLRFLRSVSINREHIEAGSILEIEDKNALSLISDGSAEIFEKPEKQPRETAESKQHGKEKASR